MVYDYARMGYWLVLPCQSLRGHPRLKIAPAGVVPQRDCRPRPIIDYSFNAFNQTTVPLAPYQSMQFRNALQRTLQHIAYCNPAFGPPLLSKVDLSDGYYRIPLISDAGLQLAVTLPPKKDSPPLLAIPLSLPMGWSLSPPFFCAHRNVRGLDQHCSDRPAMPSLYRGNNAPDSGAGPPCLPPISSSTLQPEPTSNSPGTHRCLHR
jgi:hypothetical protein